MGNKDAKALADKISQGTKEIVESTGKEYKPATLESPTLVGDDRKETSEHVTAQIEQSTKDEIERQDLYHKVYGGKRKLHYPG